ncbi:DUF3037 domain-containing protein [Thalassoroseus pseudoceratinae]|uniref:DUF3037 domain-containing protein n=1 Tax=Thalassoroseus pseudoceratinae TaxID=2713176 RepID=UPI00141DC301|nr:DUF3037 domain-containing protein [Thalassoroseus pseudoceratinae]
MKPQRGYYSLIQFVPDASRLEAVNMGVVLFCPDSGYLRARTSGSNKRAEKLVGRGNLEKEALNAAKDAIEKRLEVDRESFRDIEDLEQYIDTRANWLKLTKARPVKVFHPETELDKLFVELVGGRPSRQAKADSRELFPDLHDVFQRLELEGRAQLDVKVTVPVLQRSLNVPYAYQNGVWNLVKPQRFSSKESASIKTAMGLAMEGDLVKRHGTKPQNDARIIVVLSFDEPENTALVSKVDSLFNEYHVETVAKNRIPDFVAKVEREAH